MALMRSIWQRQPTGFNIGIGASGGGLAAFEQFFSHMPSDLASDVAIVLVQHLDPHHKSLLVELIARYAKMPVFEAEDGAVVVRGQF